MTPGSLIGKQYRLTRQLGTGAMGVVWAAVNEKTSREVALKLILKSTEEFRHRLMREARACGALQHRNIVDIYDVGQTDDGDPFLVMQLLQGETLGERLARQRRLDPPDAAAIGRDVARALEAAHGASIIHRDLKPANVFLHREAGSEGAVVKVLDFGVSKHLGAGDGMSTVAGAMVGSPAYMSPEQARGDRSIDHRADLWSVGVVLFEMLTGVRPFQGDTTQLMVKIATGEIPLASRYVRRIDEGLVQLVARCLERDLDKRIPTAKALAEQLDHYVSSPSARAPMPSEARLPSADMASAPARIEPPSAPVPGITPAPRPMLDPATRSPRPPAMQAAPVMPDSDSDELDAATQPLDPRKLAAFVRPPPSHGASSPAEPSPPSSRQMPRSAGTIPLSPPSDPLASRMAPVSLMAAPAMPTTQPLGGGAPPAPTFGAPPSAPAKTTAPLPPMAAWPAAAQESLASPSTPRPSTPSRAEIDDPNASVTKHGTIRISADIVSRLPAPPAPPPPVGPTSSTTPHLHSVPRTSSSAADPEPIAPPVQRTGVYVVVGISVAAVAVLAVGAVLWLRGPSPASAGGAGDPPSGSIAAVTASANPAPAPSPTADSTASATPTATATAKASTSAALPPPRRPKPLPSPTAAPKSSSAPKFKKATPGGL